jgi:hypothetical protein
MVVDFAEFPKAFGKLPAGVSAVNWEIGVIGSQGLSKHFFNVEIRFEARLSMVFEVIFLGYAY